MPLNNELPVLSMTSADEIAMRTPDSLFSGQAIVNMIESCIPNIKNAWMVPAIDVETLLIAIRIASVSETMEMSVACEACKADSDYAVDLQYHLSTFDASLWLQPLVIDALSFGFRPQNYQELSDYNGKMFQIRKRWSQLQYIEDADQKESLMSELITELNKLEVEYVIGCIDSISINNTQAVNNRDHIGEFITNCEKKLYDQIHTHVVRLRDATKCNRLDLTCPECQHKFSIDFSLDYSDFFVKGS